MGGEKWYYLLSTGEVVRGKLHGWDDRMGPYDTEAEARAALERVRARNAAADEWDEAEDDWGEPPRSGD